MGNKCCRIPFDNFSVKSNGDLLFATEYSLDDNGEGVNDNDLDNGDGVNDLDDDDDDDGVFILYFFLMPSIFPPILVELCKVKILRLLYWWMGVPTLHSSHFRNV